MKAARLVGPQRLEIGEHPAPKPQKGEVLVRLERFSICGSDMRPYRQVLPEEKYPQAVGRPCHECAGEIVESRADGFKPGQRVIVLPLEQLGLVEYIASSPKRMIPLPAGGDLTNWGMCQPVGTVMYSCAQMGSLIGKTVVVQGAGAIGQAFTFLIAKYGAERVITVDPIQYRLDKSLKAGATHAFNPLHENVEAAVSQLTGGQMADVVVEAAGTPESVNHCLDLVKKGGLIVLFGLMQETVIPFEHYKMTRKFPKILPTVSVAEEDPTFFIKKAVSLVEQGRMELSWMVTHRLPFEKVQQAYDMYEKRTDDVIKVVMEL